MSASHTTATAPAEPVDTAGEPPGRKTQEQRKRSSRALRRGERLTGYTFMTPWIIGTLIFTITPMIWSLYLSFTDYRVPMGGEWIGFGNYVEILGDPEFLRAVRVTLLYVVLAVPVKLASALLVAMLLTQKRRGMGFYRAAFYMPSLIGMSVGIALIWRQLFKSDGPQDTVMGFFGWEGGGFLGNPSVSLLMLVLLAVWTFGAPMVIFLAGLMQVPGELYEAAECDGASRWRKFWHITVPMLSPVIFFNVLLETVGAFQLFGPAFIIGAGNGAPVANDFYTVRLYKTAFEERFMGEGSAWAWILVLAVGVVALIMFRAAKSLVYYAGEDNK